MNQHVTELYTERARLPSNSFETLWVNGGDLFKGTCCEYRKWQVTLDKKS